MTDDLPRRVRYNLGRAEDQLDIAIAALVRVQALDADWQHEFASDLDILRSKIGTLDEILSNGGAVVGGLGGRAVVGGLVGPGRGGWGG